MDIKPIVDLLGWIASLEIVLAFALNSYKKLDSRSTLYQVLNATGAFFLIINTGYYGAFPSTALNVVWMLIALSALLFKKRKTMETYEEQ